MQEAFVSQRIRIARNVTLRFLQSRLLVRNPSHTNAGPLLYVSHVYPKSCRKRNLGPETQFVTSYLTGLINWLID